MKRDITRQKASQGKANMTARNKISASMEMRWRGFVVFAFFFSVIGRVVGRRQDRVGSKEMG